MKMSGRPRPFASARKAFSENRRDLRPREGMRRPPARFVESLYEQRCGLFANQLGLRAQVGNNHASAIVKRDERDRALVGKSGRENVRAREAVEVARDREAEVIEHRRRDVDD